jgi:predicted secreted protein
MAREYSFTKEFTNPTAGTDGEIIVEEGSNILNGWYYEPQPELRPTVPGGGIIALKLATAITGTVQVGIQFAEGLSG